jgi:hypothetical protein
VRRRLRGVHRILGALRKTRLRVLVDPVRDRRGPGRLDVEAREDPLELFLRVLVDGAILCIDQVVEVEAPLHVDEPALDRSDLVDGQHRQRLCPCLAQVIDLRFARVLAQDVGSPRFGAKRNLVCLVRRDQHRRAALIEEAFERDVAREHHRECEDDHRRDQRDAALTCAGAASNAHPATSISRLIWPQSSRSA